jgi:beta-phosphoglucomutase-like phosphatase (HAD superfamily)
VSIGNVSRTLCKLYSTDSGKFDSIAQELGSDIDQLDHATKRFLIYNPRLGGFSFANSHPAATQIPLNIQYSTLNSLARSPQAFVFDLDDCLIMSEKSHKKAWSAAIKAWAEHVGLCTGSRNDQASVAKLCRTVEYCLDKDQTHQLLSLLCAICTNRGINVAHAPHETKERALENAFSFFRAEALSRSLLAGEIRFAPGSLELLEHSFLDGKRIGLCSNSPKIIVDRLLNELTSRDPHRDLNELLPTTARVYGDTTLHRKPFPLGWLQVAQQLKCTPNQVMIFDNSFGNCVAASDLARYRHHPELVALGPDFQTQEFAGVVGITNRNPCHMSLWRNWSTASSLKTIKVTVEGLNKIVVS